MTIYVKLDVRFYHHPKVQRAGMRAADLFISALMWSQEELTDGIIPKACVRMLASRVEVKPSEAGALVREGLWHDHDDHYEIHDWQDWLKSRAQVYAERGATKQRQAEYRARNALRNAVTNAVTNGLNDALVTPHVTAPRRA